MDAGRRRRMVIIIGASIALSIIGLARWIVK
jgi:hypothetical protein